MTRLYKKVDRVLGRGDALGTVWEDEDGSCPYWAVCVHWDGQPTPTGGDDDGMDTAELLTLVDAGPVSP